MSAIRPHSTAVDTKSDWDGPKAVADAPNDADVLRYMHAWVDDEGDPDAKQSYKFPHHEPRIGAPAVIAAVNNALARLPQAEIPDADREGVERHLRKHREDAGLENNAANPLVERRTLAVRELVTSEAGEGEPSMIIGYAAVFNQWSEDLGGFREMILPGAFSNVLNDDVRALINHDANMVLGRTRSGTLELSEDEIGLRIKIVLPNTQYARDLIEAMKRGDVDQMSFGFSVAKDNWYEQEGQTRREIVKIERLYDVSVVTFPAYPQTVAQARDVLKMRNPEPSGQAEDGRDALQTESGQVSLDVRRKKIQLLTLKWR